MMKRKISFVLHICIITNLLFNCSKCAEQAKFVHTTDGINMPANTLHTAISNFGESENDRSGNKTSFDDEDKLNYAQKKMIINESSQRIGDDIVYLPNQNGYSHENRHKNNDTHSIDVESQMQKRAIEPQDICDTNECKCKFETKFLTVDCHFQQVSTLFLCIFNRLFMGFYLL